MSGENRPPPSADPSISRGIAMLFHAIASAAKNDRLSVAAARGELVALADATEDFEGQLVAAVVDRLVARHICPNATREEIEQAVRIDVRRHVGSSLFLARVPAWGNA